MRFVDGNGVSSANADFSSVISKRSIRSQRYTFEEENDSSTYYFQSKMKQL